MGQYQSDELGKSFGRYRIVHKIGQGGMADVFLALLNGPAGFNKLVVLKVIRPSFGDDPDAIAMFLDEARLAGRLNHPNVVQTSEVSEIEGRHTIVMEYMEGRNLSEIVGKDNQVPLPASMFLKVLSEALQGLHYVHELNGFDGKSLALVHRDLSPQNIFLTYDGQVKLLDFGIAKAAISLCETRVGMMKGKLSYMAPEQLSHEHLDRRADIYGAGAVLFSLLTGDRLWKGMPPAQALVNLLAGNILSPSSLCPDLNPQLERICLKALSRNPKDRYQTALEMRDDLQAVIESLGDKTSLRDLGALAAVS